MGKIYESNTKSLPQHHACITMQENLLASHANRTNRSKYLRAAVRHSRGRFGMGAAVKRKKATRHPAGLTHPDAGLLNAF
jgi:hypothetical protein